MTPTYGGVREEHVLQPISGKAVPVRKGEVFRVIQEEGGMCVDFNCFNLHDYEEHMETSSSRRQGFHIPKGGFAISDSPRNRLMLQVIEKPDTCVIDLLGHRCNPAMCEAVWGTANHTNCQDSLAEAIGEYGLSPDHTHATYTLWMPTGWDDEGHWWIKRNDGVVKGDYVDCLALMDTLCVVCLCGQNDVSPLGNWFAAPIRIQVLGQSEETERRVREIEERWPELSGSQKPEEFRVKHRVEDRELRKVEGYEPQFKRFPLRFEDVEVEIDASDYEEAERLVAAGLRTDVQDAIRSGVLEWYTANRIGHHPLYGSVGGASYWA